MSQMLNTKSLIVELKSKISGRLLKIYLAPVFNLFIQDIRRIPLPRLCIFLLEIILKVIKSSYQCNASFGCVLKSLAPLHKLGRYFIFCFWILIWYLYYLHIYLEKMKYFYNKLWKFKQHYIPIGIERYIGIKHSKYYISAWCE